MDVLRDLIFFSFEIYVDYNSMEIKGKKNEKEFFIEILYIFIKMLIINIYRFF